jgi:hypothetical protein
MTTPEIRFYLLICSDTIAPESISARLGISPTGTNRKGEVWNNRTGKLFPYHCWQLSSPAERSWDLNDQIAKVMAQLVPAKEPLASLLAERGTEAHFSSVIWMYGGRTPAIYLSSPVVKFAGDLGIDFDFDTYIGDDEG